MRPAGKFVVNPWYETTYNKIFFLLDFGSPHGIIGCNSKTLGFFGGKKMNAVQLSDPRDMQIGDHIEFDYHSRTRTGIVRHIDKRYFTLEHDSPADFDGKQYSNYRFLSLGSRISLL